MNNLIIDIFRREFSETILTVGEISGLGSVNRIFEVYGKYRWAEGQGVSGIEDYTEKIRKAFDEINKK